MWSFTSEQIDRLEALHSSVRFSHRSAPKNDAGEPTGQDVTVASLVDNYQDKVWATAEVPGTGDEGERKALEAVLKKAVPGDRPLTPAELAAENRRLREELARARGGTGAEPQREDEAGGEAEPGEPVGAGDSQPASGFDDLSPNELAQALRGRGLDVPAGNRKSREWRAEAVRRLNDA